MSGPFAPDRDHAFELLLAVAKAAERIDEHSSISHMSNDLYNALLALTAAHPDWRTWQP